METFQMVNKVLQHIVICKSESLRKLWRVKTIIRDVKSKVSIWILLLVVRVGMVKAIIAV
ncbi:CLUMA_CG015708, isoform A [Clunio marinus]|uniref:CLUMA_CG015708, isoform A n=1 Tax=Clunio marinus TaxID=568069 RepID=A0A1J1INS8_9DIPT|nr:CLUMA_CG015708, isoform A [Clunio marinus]